MSEWWVDCPQLPLTSDQWELAAKIGCKRRIDSVLRDYQNPNTGNDSWDMDIEGALAELVVAEYLGLEWSQSIDNLDGPDVGYNVQVRSTHNVDSPELPVREKDKPGDYFVSVAHVPRCKNFIIAGCIPGVFAKTDEFWRNANQKGVGYWAVPQKRLSSVRNLKRHLDMLPIPVL